MGSRILIVGGTGLTGAHAALHLADSGHEVTLMSRTAPEVECLKRFAHIAADYTQNPPQQSSLEAFDQMIFAAGADIRSFPQGEDEALFYDRVNTRAIPDFFRLARDAGINRAVYIGTYYPQVVPEAIARSPYVRSRHLTDVAVRELDSENFRVCSLNAPFILGHVPGMHIPHLAVLVDYALGRLEGMPLVAPAGGVNHITSLSMSQAIEGALRQGKGGHAYLVGDENLSWKAYLELFFAAAGNPTELPVTDEEHPLFPDAILYAGRNAVISYEGENGELGYSQNQVADTVAQLVRAYS